MYIKSLFLTIAYVTVSIFSLLNFGDHAIAQSNTINLNALTSEAPVTPLESNASVSVPDLQVYQDGIQSPWQNNSWSATVTYGSTELVYAGANAVKVVQNAWGGLSLHSGVWGSAVNVDPINYSGFEFAFYARTTGVSIAVKLENDQGAAFPLVNYGTVSANQWVIVSLPISQLNPNNQLIHRISILDMSGTTKTYYVDNIRFVGKSESSPPIAPVLATPSNGATGLSVTPTLTWNASIGATSYRTQISTSSSFSPILADQSGVTSLSYSPGSLSNNTIYYWRVNASNSSGTSAWSAVANFTTVTVPIAPSAPVLTLPANGATGVSTNPSLQWNASVGAISYRVQGSTSSSFSPILVDQSGVTSLSHSPGSLLNNTIYYWRVNASNSSGTSAWSAVANFTTIAVLPAPSVPVLSSPVSGATGVSINPSLQWNTSTGAASYRLQISTSSIFSATILDQSGLTLSTFAASGLLNGTAYYWRVNASNTSGTSAWSAVANFATVAVLPAPPVPVLSLPASGATGVSINPALQWNASAGAASYRIQVSTNSSFSSMLIDQSNVTTVSYNLSSLSYSTPYYWRVNASNTSGTSSWSTARTFTTGAAPVNTSDLQVYQDGIQSPWQNSSWNATVTYGSTERVYAGANAIKVVQNAWGILSLHSGAWGATVNVDPIKYSRFEFVVNGGATGLSISAKFENDQDQAFPLISFGTVPANQWVTVSLPISQLNPSNQMIHRISILDMNGSVKTYYVDNIRFIGTAPAAVPIAPVLASPSNGATGVNIPSVLSWNTVSGASTYRLQISTSSTFATTIADQVGLVVPTLTPSSLLNATTYYWRVNASNSSGTSAWSAVANFTTVAVLVPPSVPVLSTPASGATGVSTTPTLQWNAASGAGSYRIQVSTSSTFSSTLVDQSNILTISFNPTALSFSTTYYWRVNATNILGTSGWSSSRSFVTASAPPPGGNMFVTAYYPDWSIWTMPPWVVDYSALTHIIHFSADPDPSTVPYFSPVTKASDSLKLQYGNGNSGRSVNFQDSLIHYSHKNGVKALLCIGGIYGTSDANMDAVCSDINKIRVFVSSISSYCKRKGYDGVDVDWEWPNNSQDYINLLTVLRDTLNSWPVRGVITAAVYAMPSGVFIGARDAMNSKLDQMMTMNYDMGVSTYAGFNSPLKPGVCAFAGGNWTAWTIADHGPQNWVNAGFDKSKMALGIPFYAWEFTGVDGPCQLRTGGAFYRSYENVLSNMSQYPNSYRWDDSSKVPYLSFTDGSGVKHMVSYDNALSTAYKVKHAKASGIGGIMIYELQGGWASSKPVGQKDPLLQAVKQAVNGTFVFPSVNTPQSNTGEESIQSEVTVPKKFGLDPNFPNPFNPTTTIGYQVPVNSMVTIKIYDMLGREVITLVDETMDAGAYTIAWNSRDVTGNSVASGTYIYRMMAVPVDGSQTPTFTSVRKLMLMK